MISRYPGFESWVLEVFWTPNPRFWDPGSPNPRFWGPKNPKKPGFWGFIANLSPNMTQGSKVTQKGESKGPKKALNHDQKVKKGVKNPDLGVPESQNLWFQDAKNEILEKRSKTDEELFNEKPEISDLGLSRGGVPDFSGYFEKSSKRGS